MRTALALVVLIATGPAWAAKMPDETCSAQFVKKWRADKVAMVEHPQLMPARACVMRTEKGDYVCSKVGCVSAYAYTADE